MKKKKYELIDKVDIVDGHTLYRIRALGNLRYVEKYDLGGWIESEDNLSHDGKCWVSGNARVYGNARITGNARVGGNAKVFGEAQVSENARVFGSAQVFGNAHLIEMAWICEETKLDSGIWDKSVHNHKWYIISTTLRKLLLR